MPFKLLNLGSTLLCMVSNDAYFRALSSGTNNSKTRTYDLFTRERRYPVPISHSVTQIQPLADTVHSKHSFTFIYFLFT